mmetsp:Transcript_30728/g.64159  ORF Transcript_30728/g.64159 Transcript_30728/m.64159 type:complete len:161 (+) Transcript_30728:24-506(+)
MVMAATSVSHSSPRNLKETAKETVAESKPERESINGVEAGPTQVCTLESAQPLWPWSDELQAIPNPKPVPSSTFLHHCLSRHPVVSAALQHCQPHTTSAKERQRDCPFRRFIRLVRGLVLHQFHANAIINTIFHASANAHTNFEAIFDSRLRFPVRSPPL